MALEKFCSSVLLVAVLALAISCKRDENKVTTEDSDIIAFDIAINGDIGTKSNDKKSKKNNSIENSHLLCTLGVDSIYIFASEHKNSEQMFADCEKPQQSTKGAPIEDPHIGTNNKLSQFFITAKLNNNQIYFADEPVLVTEGTTNPKRFWPNEQLNFMAYAPDDAKTKVTNLLFSRVSASDPFTGSFSYDMPQPLTGVNEGKDAENLPDFIYTIATEKTGGTGSVSLKFHHPFSAICFQIGDMPQKVFIDYIALKDIKTSGNCNFIESNDKTDIVFTWSGHSQKRSYKQYFKANINNDDITGSLKEDDALNSKEETFMVIPQDFPDNTATLEVSLSVAGNNYTLSKPLKDIAHSGWKPDTKYVYTISIPEDVDIEIEDKTHGPVKSELHMVNKGFSLSYIRASIVGYWITENSDIVSDWKGTPVNIGTSAGADGEFICNSLWDNYWIYNDGFYYYKYPIKAGKEPTVPLFDSYTLNALPPIVNSKLQLNVMVQSVIASKVKQADWPWPLNLSNGLEELPE